jgi:hypothetical protein
MKKKIILVLLISQTLLVLPIGLFMVKALPYFQIITAEGELWYIEGNQLPFMFEFDPNGGEVNGSSASITIEDTYGNYYSKIIIFNGNFSGGDAGVIKGTCELEIIPQPSGFINNACFWEGYLYADGHGEGIIWEVWQDQTNTGQWVVNFSPDEFLNNSSHEESSPQHETKPQEPESTSIISTLTQIPQDTIGTNSSEEIIDAIIYERQYYFSDFSKFPSTQLLVWDGILVNINLNQFMHPYLQDAYGHKVEIDESGNPIDESYFIESAAVKVIEENPQVDWDSVLNALYEKISLVSQQLFSPTTEIVDISVKKPTLSPFYGELVDIFGHNETNGIDTTDIERLSVQTEFYSLHTLGITSKLSNTTEILMNQVLEDTRQSSASRWNETISNGFKTIIQQEFNNSSIVPKEVTDEFYNKVVSVIAEEELNKLAEKAGLDPKAAESLADKLRKIGVQEESLAKTLNAVQALRVLGNMADGHTVSTSGVWDKLFSFVDSWVAYRAATEAIINDPDLNMSRDQLEMIQNSIEELNVFDEGVENFAVNQFKDQIINLINEQLDN